MFRYLQATKRIHTKKYSILEKSQVKTQINASDYGFREKSGMVIQI